MINTRRKAALLVAGIVSVAAAGVGQSAQAANTCSVWAEKKVVNNAPDKWRVGANCSDLNNGVKAQGVGVVSVIRDHETGWFTRLDTNHFSDWGKGGIDALEMHYK